MTQAISLKKKVLWCLEEFPETRNDDNKLIAAVWRTFYPTAITRNHINIDHLCYVASAAGIVRWRAKFQNELGLCLPTDWKVAEKRNINRAAWEKALGYGKQMELAI